MEFPGLLVLGLKSSEGWSFVFSAISRGKIKSLKIPVGVLKKVFPQSHLLLFFSEKGHLLKTERVNQSMAEGKFKKT